MVKINVTGDFTDGIEEFLDYLSFQPSMIIQANLLSINDYYNNGTGYNLRASFKGSFNPFYNQGSINEISSRFVSTSFGVTTVHWDFEITDFSIQQSQLIRFDYVPGQPISYDFTSTNKANLIRTLNFFGIDLVGSNEDDRVTSNRILDYSSNDTFVMGAGDDYVSAGSGDDSFKGEDGDDTVFGDNGTDTLDGGNGNDYLSGGSGNDEIFGGDGEDRLYGREGSDHVDGGAGKDLIAGEEGNDTLFGGTANDRITGGDSDDSILGGGNNDFLKGENGNDSLFGGSGNDRLFGNADTDTLVGGAGRDTLNGGNGKDQLLGGKGNDLLIGGRGFDVLFGGAGNDTLRGIEGRDTLTGGTGADVFEFATGTHTHVIADFQNGIDRIKVLNASSFADLTVTARATDVLVSDGTQKLLLLNVDATLIDANDFIF